MQLFAADCTESNDDEMELKSSLERSQNNGDCKVCDQIHILQ
jgi:hypothetical protein